MIGGGFSGLSSACFLAKAGHDVTIFEKNDTLGGRARAFSAHGFTFDMGPSWYWMPDVFEKFFGYFNTTPCAYYDLVKLDPGFQMIFGKDDVVPIPAELDDIFTLFETIEPGSAAKLRQFLHDAEQKYNIGMRDLVYKPSVSWAEFVSLPLFRHLFKLSVFDSISSYVRGYFNDPRIIALMEFPSLFLGAMPDKIPALYSLMNYAALSMGTWYPMGGMCRIVAAMETLALSLGVTIKTGHAVDRIDVSEGACRSLLMTDGSKYTVDAVVAGNDYHHTEDKLLGSRYRNYGAGYWDKKVMAPSCLIFYVGVRKKIPRLIHHNLFFDHSLKEHAKSIYKHPRWPKDPLFYVCCPSKTDPIIAPDGMENLFILIPIACGLDDNQETRDEYYQHVIHRMEEWCGVLFADDVIYQRSYCLKEFVSDYNAFKGNAYGLANTLSQTAILKPSIRNKKIKNLFYAGQLTVPGPGVPPSLISGQIAAQQLLHSIGK